tara:strand:- start:395 stop:1018 length:624 start_codon:yes stop_codon:yes gene_type:complete
MRRYKPTNSKISVDEKGRVSFTEEISSAKYKGYPTKYAALHGQLGLKTLAQAKAIDHLIVAHGKKPDALVRLQKGMGAKMFQDIVDLLNLDTKPKDLKDTEKKLKAGFHHEDVQTEETEISETKNTELTELKNDQVLYYGDYFALSQSPNGIFLGISIDRAKGKGGAETSSGNSIPPKLGYKGMADTLYMDKKYFMKFLKEIKGLRM